MSIRTRNSLLLGFASIIWGISFVIQQIGGMELGAYTFNSTRMFIGALAVYLITFIFDKKGFSRRPATSADRRKLWLAGIACGVFLSIATNLQQVALNYGGSTGKAGFLTSVYILLVPIMGLFFHTKCGWNIWVSVAIALVGLYFLCISGNLTLDTPDILLLGCAVAFAFQILTIDRFGGSCDGLRLSAIEFLTVAVISAVLAVIFEVIPFEGTAGQWAYQFTNWKVWMPLLYMGLLSSGVAYTLQIICQKNLHPAVASLLMSLESVFALFAGMIILRQTMSGREIFGCVLMFIAIILSQINFSKRQKQ